MSMTKYCVWFAKTLHKPRKIKANYNFNIFRLCLVITDQLNNLSWDCLGKSAMITPVVEQLSLSAHLLWSSRFELNTNKTFNNILNTNKAAITKRGSLKSKTHSDFKDQGMLRPICSDRVVLREHQQHFHATPPRRSTPSCCSTPTRCSTTTTISIPTKQMHNKTNMWST